MKRIITIVLCTSIITTFLTGCGSKEKSNVNSANSDEWQTVIFGETEDSTIFHADEMSTDKFSVRDQKKEDVKKRSQLICGAQSTWGFIQKL